MDEGERGSERRRSRSRLRRAHRAGSTAGEWQWVLLVRGCHCHSDRAGWGEAAAGVGTF